MAKSLVSDAILKCAMPETMACVFFHIDDKPSNTILHIILDIYHIDFASCSEFDLVHGVDGRGLLPQKKVDSSGPLQMMRFGVPNKKLH